MDDDDESPIITFSARNPKKDVFKEVDLRAREKQSGDAKLTYKDAVHLVFRADPDLHRAYVTSTPPLRHTQE